jgi:monoterpene epsilon-lactone hydrolase
MNLLIFFLILVLVFWAFEFFYLRGAPRAKYTAPAEADVHRVFGRGQEPGPQHEAVVKTVKDLTGQIAVALDKHDLRTARAVFDSISAGRDYVSEFLPVDAGGVDAEWVIAPGADPARRVLYIHGGGFIMGCPKSHRSITSKFSEVTGCSVLAIDYRLMPENRHRDCVADCRTAYQWILENGPDGPGKTQQLFFGGDSAGGNLALSLVAWVRDNKLRAPDAVVAMSPLTDVTFSGASIRENAATDIMLKRVMGTLNKLPAFIKSWWVVWTYRLRPADPVASPLLGDLSNLPPTLVQASEAEMLLDDARRYVYKAFASGSPIKLQTWTNMVHIWQIFVPQLPQAVEAWSEIKKFLEENSP